ncbi:unnamed protein product [Tuber aestivum]|uniref:Uncharacterized protein n=1 Tax=Tuber aestivum TaxID=59557 RepID=A0A292QA63_9PEZI|nr:unnamed protein product [Tuber aestivum]
MLAPTRRIRNASTALREPVILKQLPNKPIGQIRPHGHYRNHPRPTDSSPQFGDALIYGSGPEDFCDPPTTMTATAPGPTIVGGAQREPVTSTVTLTANGVDTRLFDGIFGPIDISQSVNPERVIAVTMETSTVALSGSTETVTVRATGSEVTVTEETSEVTVTVLAQNAGGVSGTIATYSTSAIAVRGAKLHPPRRHESASPKINRRAPAPGRGTGATSSLAPSNNLTYHNASTSAGEPTPVPAPIAATPTETDSPSTTSTTGSSAKDFSRVGSSAPAEPSTNAFGEDVEDPNSHEDIAALAAELRIERVHHSGGFVPDYAPKKTATLAPPATATASR